MLLLPSPLKAHWPNKADFSPPRGHSTREKKSMDSGCTPTLGTSIQHMPLWMYQTSNRRVVSLYHTSCVWGDRVSLCVPNRPRCYDDGRMICFSCYVLCSAVHRGKGRTVGAWTQGPWLNSASLPSRLCFARSVGMPSNCSQISQSHNKDIVNHFQSKKDRNFVL